MLHLNNRKVGFPSQFQTKHNSPAHGADTQLCTSLHIFHFKERVCDKAEDLAPGLRQVESVAKGNIIYHLQKNLQPLILHKCF